MTYSRNCPPLISKNHTDHSSHRQSQPPYSFARKRPCSSPLHTPSPSSPGHPYLSSLGNQPSAHLRSRQLPSHFLAHSSKPSSFRRSRKRSRIECLSSSTPTDFREKSFSVTTPGISSAAFSSASLSQDTSFCVSMGNEDGESVAYVWRVSANPLSLKLCSKLRHPHRVYRAVSSSDASTVITTSQDGDVRVWSAAGLNYKSKKLTCHRPYRNARACALSQDGKYAAVSFYKGSKRPIEHEYLPISSFQSQVFVTRTHSNLELFRMHENGIVDQIIMCENASVVAIGLCGVYPAPNIARGHRIVLVDNRGRRLKVFQDCFPPDEHSCTAWHMPSNGSMLALCSKDNSLLVYRSGPRKDWSLPPTLIFSRAFDKFSHCRFASHNNFLAAAGTHGNSKETCLGLFRVSDATLVFLIPTHVPLGSVLDIYPYASLDSKRTNETSLSVSVLSSSSSISGSILNLNLFSNSKQPFQPLKNSESEKNITNPERRTRLKLAHENPGQNGNPAPTPYELCRDPSPFIEPRLESPSISRSSAAPRSSGSPARTPLHNRFASWLNDRKAQNINSNSETESQSSRRGKNRREGHAEQLAVSAPSEIAKDCVKQKAHVSLQSDYVPPVSEKQGDIQFKNPEIHNGPQEPVQEPESLENTTATANFTKTSALPETKNTGTGPESTLQSKDSVILTDGMQTKDITSEENGEKRRFLDNASRVLDAGVAGTVNPRGSQNIREERKEAIQEKNPLLPKTSEVSHQLELHKPTGADIKSKERFAVSDSPQKREALSKHSDHHDATVRTEARKGSNTAVSTPHSSQDLNQSPRARPDNLAHCIKMDASGQNGELAKKKAALHRSVTAEGASKTLIGLKSVKACDVVKGNNGIAAVKNSPRAGDVTHEQRFAAIEHHKTRNSNFELGGSESMQHGACSLKKGTAERMDIDPLLKGVNDHQCGENKEQNSQNADLAEPMTGNRTSSAKESSSQCALELGKQNVKTNEIFSASEGLVGITEQESTEEAVKRKKITGKDGCDTNLSRAVARNVHATGVCDSRKADNIKVEDVLSGDHDLSVPNVTPIRTSPESGEKVEKGSECCEDGQSQPRTAVLKISEGSHEKVHLPQGMIDELGIPISIPTRYIKRCKEVFSEACRGYLLTDSKLLTNQEAYTTMLGFTTKNLGYADEKCVAKMIYNVVGIRNACTQELFLDAFQLIFEKVVLSRRLFWANVFGGATSKAEESILVFHALDLVKTEQARGTLHLAKKWSDNELEVLFERVCDGMLVDLKSFLLCVDKIIDE